jgi:predicted nucleic acid-binding protein
VARLVLIDASPLIGLSIAGGLPWLRDLFGVVWIPEEVRREGLSGQVDRGESDIREALAAGWLRVWSEPIADPGLGDLDEGEAACIGIGMAHPGDVLVLMDERAGRTVAAERGLRVAGTAAVIGLAKTRGLIPSARRVFDVLHQSDFRISAEVIQTVLAKVGE